MFLLCLEVRPAELEVEVAVCIPNPSYFCIRVELH